MPMSSIRPLPPPPPNRQGWPWTAPTGTREKQRTAESGWPRITIVTPSYNQGPFLEATIRSVLLQDYPNLEYFVMDGGSTDESVEIIRKYEDHLAGWTSERDGGQSDSINKGLAKATGDVLAYLNSDDLYLPGALAACGEAAGAGNEWIAGSVTCWDGGDSYWPFPEIPGRTFARWLIGSPLAQAGCFWSSRLYRVAGRFREDLNYVLDYEYWLRLRFRHGIEPFRLRRPVAIFRIHAEAKSVASVDAMREEIVRLQSEYCAGLSGSERLWLGVVRRNRMARVHAARGVDLLKRQNYRSAAGALWTSFTTWPFAALDPTAVLETARRLRADPRPSSPFPDTWQE